MKKLKYEDWLNNYPGPKKMLGYHKNLTSRKLAVVSAALLESALKQLIEKRLIDDQDFAISFLNSFSMQMASKLSYLLGIIDKDDFKVITTVAEIRNEFAHTVDVTFLSKEIQQLLRQLYKDWMKRHRDTIETEDSHEWWENIAFI